jgi:hypothetical protein
MKREIIDAETFMKKTKTNLKFIDVGGLGKTKIFNVYSTHSDDFLGVIHWRIGWRCYVFSYQPDIDMSLSCTKEVAEFMQKLEDERKERLR